MTDNWDALLTGSSEALESIYEKTYRDLFAYGVMLGYSRDDVKDGIQYMFLTIWERRAQLSPVKSVKSYLYTWLRRTLNDRRQGKKPVLSVDDQSDTYSISQEDIIMRAELAKEIADKLRLGLDQLSGKQRQAIEYRYFQKLSYEEIALRTDSSVRTIYNLVSESVKILRKKVKK